MRSLALTLLSTAIAFPQVTAEAFEATDPPELVRKSLVRGVPETVRNEDLSLEGAVPKERLLEMVAGPVEKGRSDPRSVTQTTCVGVEPAGDPQLAVSG